MNWPLAALVLAAVFFVGIHVFVSGTALRCWIVGRIGEGPFRGAFSLALAAGLVGLGWSYGVAQHFAFWHAEWLRWVPLVLLPFAVILAVGAFTKRNPAAGGAKAAGRTPQGFVTVTRHPFLVAVGLWAIGHLAANGDIASLILFAALLLLAVVGARQIDPKRRRSGGEDWRRFEAGTSIVPFATTLAGRDTMGLGDVGWWRIALGLALYAVALWVHAWMFGVSALP